MGQGSVGPLVVVVGGKGAGLGLEPGEGGGWGLGGQPFLQGLLEPLDLALGLGVVRPAVLLPGSQPPQFVLEAVAAAAAARTTPRPRARPGDSSRLCRNG